MAVLTVNAGSNSLHLVLVDGDRVLDRCDLADPPGAAPATEAVRAFVSGRDAPAAVAHRLVHGGDLVRRPTIVDDELRAGLDRVADLAPLHVPPALTLLDTLRELLPDVPHVVCPDDAFHAGLPAHAATYPLPARWRERWGLRRHGFHGLSYAYATVRAAELLQRPVDRLQMVLAHLGGGASVCAVRDGRSVDTSMGFTPLDGVPMSKRSGAVDPGMLLWLLDGRLTLDELTDGLYHHSGLLGLSGGRSGDTRDLVGDPALDVFTHRVRREIAAAATSLDRLDAVVFTGEIGWDQPEVRHAVCAGLGLLGVPLPVTGNRDEDGPISPAESRIAVLVVEPREELQLAREAGTALRGDREDLARPLSRRGPGSDSRASRRPPAGR
ncbi:acetate/propionate family kinase [Actinoplanes teichomyceticus]|uniref:Acetate kinase n=1 Tax=Actinoplanes teichomyceticus TaxID=1867 RepID=A0A561VLN8_ACTTI|nr:acetate kinase [Actinoplanes teichomyceticus]TWG12522.1 acetate kinase [Actinoplanes teichomyceticus]GIF13886.1 acetate kinase [Actinoplanes teichomyceticus]